MSTTGVKARAGFGQPSAAAIDDAWQRQATRAAIEGCRKVINDGVIPANQRVRNTSFRLSQYSITH